MRKKATFTLQPFPYYCDLAGPSTSPSLSSSVHGYSQAKGSAFMQPVVAFICFCFGFPLLPSLPCCFQVAQTVSLLLSPILGLYTVLGSNNPLYDFTAVLLFQKPFVSKGFLNSPRSCSDFFNSSVLSSN